MKRQTHAHANYEEDFHAWANEQAGLLRDRKMHVADLDNIAEELEGLSRSERRALLSSLRLIVLHLLKLQHQSDRASASWRNTIARERLNVEEALADMPSLRPQLPALFAKACRDGRRLAIVETGLPSERFPGDQEFTLEQVCDGSFLPDPDLFLNPLPIEPDTPVGASRALLRRLKDPDRT